MLELSIAPSNRSSCYREIRERERLESTRNLVILWTFFMESKLVLSGECTESVMQWESFPCWHLCECVNRKTCSAVVRKQNTCMSLISWCSLEKVSRWLVCCVRLKVRIVCEYFRRAWTRGFIEDSQCAMFSDPLFFGYNTTTIKRNIHS